MSIQMPGAQVMAYPNMKKQAETIITAIKRSVNIKTEYKQARCQLTYADTLIPRCRWIFRRSSSRKHDEPRSLPEPPCNQRHATPELLHDVQSSERTEEVDCAEDDLRDERVGDADILKHRRAVVEEVIRSRELLKHLQRESQNSAVQNLVIRLETIDPACLELSFVLVVADHVLNLVRDDRMLLELLAAVRNVCPRR